MLRRAEISLADVTAPDITIGATTVGTGEDWSPTFRLGTNNALVPHFLAVVFKKQEILQEVLFHNFHLIVFWF